MPSREGLVAEYLFNSTANDSSGNGCHGVAHGVTPTTDRFGRHHGAYRFDGRDDYIVVFPPPVLGETFSVSAWAQYDAEPQSGWTNCIICQDNGDDSDQSRRIFQLSTLGPNLVWHRMCQARDLMFKRRLRSGTWYHVAAVVNDGVHRLYVDGLLQDSGAYVLTPHMNEPIHIGRKGTPEASFFFRGAIDDVRLYNRALDDDEVRALFHEGGYEKPRLQDGTGADRISGRWGAHGTTFLELTLDAEGNVSGQVMSGRPDNMAPIRSGTFDPGTGALKLDGEAKHPDDGQLLPYLIEGVLDDDTLTVSYRFGPFEGNETFTQAGALPQPHKRSAVRGRLKRVALAVARWWRGLWSGSRA